jgi:ubiquinone/menaquinone biosynthesis C-methylase UbiE
METSWKSEDISSKFDKYNDMLEYILGFHFLFKIIQSDKSVKTILDYGCGPGKVSLRLTELSSDYSIIAVDESEKMLNIAKQKEITLTSAIIILAMIHFHFSVITLLTALSYVLSLLTTAIKIGYSI